MTIIIVNMARRPTFGLTYAPVTKRHLRAIEPGSYGLIRREIETQLQGGPDAETRRRKPLKRPGIFGAAWEMRFGSGDRFRVFYRVNRDERHVEILAIGEKKGSSLFVGGEEIET